MNEFLIQHMNAKETLSQICKGQKVDKIQQKESSKVKEQNLVKDKNYE